MGVIGESGGIAALNRLRIGVRRLAVAGGYEIGGPGGAVLRRLGFAERTGIVRDAAAATSPAGVIEAVTEAILSAATIREGVGDRLILELAAMALAGADEPGLPFEETARRLEATGWTRERIAASFAADVDRAGAAAQGSPDGWTRLVFGEDVPDAAEAADLDALRTSWAERLLERLGPADHHGTEGRRPGSEADAAPADDRTSTRGGRFAGAPGGREARRRRSPDPVLHAVEAGGRGARINDATWAPPAARPGREAFAFRMQLRSVVAAGREPRSAGGRKAAPPADRWGSQWNALEGVELADGPVGTGEPTAGEETLPAAALRSLPAADPVRPDPTTAGRSSRERAARNATPDEAPGRTAAASPMAAARWPARILAPAELADQIAILLDDEADLRGIDR